MTVLGHAAKDFEPDDSEVLSGLARSSTTPAPASAYQDEGEPEEAVDEDPEESEQAAVLTNPMYKTMTFDAWEQGEAWDWMHNRQSLDALGEQMDQPIEESIPEEAPLMSGPVGMMFIPQEVANCFNTSH